MIVVAMLGAVLVVGGPLAVVAFGTGWLIWRRRPRRRLAPAMRPLLMMMLVELRSGLSVLAALQSVSTRFPAEGEFATSVRVAAVLGLDAAVGKAHGEVKVMLAHLSRAVASGGSAADAIRRMIDSDLAREKALRLARTRSLPVQMMLPVSLLLLPGVVLVSYGPVLLALIDDLAVPFA